MEIMGRDHEWETGNNSEINGKNFNRGLVDRLSQQD